MLAEGTRLGGYRVIRLLGRGGMGEVYEAEQLALDRAVALKLLSSMLAETALARARFRREALAQAGIHHPNIVTVHDAGEVEDRLYIAMQIIRGPTLKQLIRVGGLDPARGMRILEGVAWALDAAHADGLVHRDVKPQNVLVGAHDHAYLADFGLTKALGDDALSSLTSTGNVVGTLSYIAPELLEGEDATSRSDIYSLAAVAFECLTGSPPFEHSSPAALVHAHAAAPVPRATERNPTLGPALDEVLARGLAKDRAERPASAAELVADVGGALGSATRIPAPPTPTTDRPVERQGPPAPPTEPPGQPPRWRRRGPLLAAGGIVAAAALAGVLLLAGDDGAPGGGGAGSGGRLVLGSALPEPELIANCSGGAPGACTIVQRRLAGHRLVAPFDGVVTGWRLRGATGRFRLVVLNPDDTVSGRTAFVTADGERELFEAQLGIADGDTVALETAAESEFGTVSAAGAEVDRWLPPLPPAGVPGSAGAPDKVDDPPHTELLMSATVEPDADADGFGDLTLDDCPDDPDRRQGC